MFPRLRLLSAWKPIQTCDWFCFSFQLTKTLKYFLNSDSFDGREADARTICLSLLGVLRTKDGSSLSNVRRSLPITRMGLNFVGATGEGKKARIVRSKSCVTKLCTTCCTGALTEAVRACGWAREGTAALEAAMVEEGGLVINPNRLHEEKPTRGEMTVYFAKYQNCTAWFLNSKTLFLMCKMITHYRTYLQNGITNTFAMPNNFYNSSNQIQTPFNCYFDIYIVREVLNFSAADLLGTKVYGSLRRKNQKHPCDHGGFRG